MSKSEAAVQRGGLDEVESRVTPAGIALLKEKRSSRELCLCPACHVIATRAEQPSKGQSFQIISRSNRRSASFTPVWVCKNIALGNQ